jgi:predicted O-methyltransferase YrrM
MTKYNIDNLIDETLHGSIDSSQHLITLYALCLSLRAKNILELGVREGHSTRALVAAAKHLNTKVDCVDIKKQNHSLLVGYENEFNFIESDALLFLKNCNTIYDFVFVDDWHEEQHVYQELSYLKNLVNINGLIVLHDLMHSYSHPHYNKTVYPAGHEFGGMGPYGAVTKFVEENKNYEYVTIPVNHGLTILRKIS